MPIRDEILCGHCAAAPGASTCPGCKLEICERCAGDRRGCANPRAVELRLGIGARLRAVDPSGRWGLASTLGRSAARIDLDRLERAEINSDLREATILASGELAGWLLDGSVYLGFRRGSRYFVGVLGDLDRSGTALIHVGSAKVSVTELDRETHAGLGPLKITIEPFRRASPSAVGFDPATRRLACATYSHIAIFDLDERRKLQGIDAESFDIAWVALAGDTVAALLSRGDGFVKKRFELVLWSSDSGAELARVRLGAPRQPLADLSDDGRIAVAADDRSEVVIVELGATGPVRLGGHSDGISALRIAGDGSRIVSGDFDNRVIFRDRGTRGYPTDLEGAQLAAIES